MSFEQHGAWVCSDTLSVGTLKPPRGPTSSLIKPKHALVNVEATSGALKRLENLGANWDGYGSARPNPQAIEAARLLVQMMSTKIAVLTPGWTKPMVSANEDGDVVMEWWHGVRKLTIYVGARAAGYIKVWGPRIDKDMEDGQVVEGNVRPLWLWLTND